MKEKKNLLETVQELIGVYDGLSIVQNGPDVVVTMKDQRVCFTRQIFADLVVGAAQYDFDFYVCDRGLVVCHPEY